MIMARPVWDIRYSMLIFLMWWIMMIAMMLPSAAPMILLFTFLNRKNGDGSAWSVTAFIMAYVFTWGGFSMLATALQWGLGETALLSPGMATQNAIFGGTLLILAGIWQLTPLKHSCLRKCRSPIHYFSHGWRVGRDGAFMMGLEHGLFCLGCCWVLMVLLFYGGVMNLWWVGGLAIYVLLEKLIPAGHWVGRGTGALLIIWGVGVLYPSI